MLEYHGWKLLPFIEGGPEWELYLLKARLEVDEEEVAQSRSKLGRFILASNNNEIDQNTMLSYYKGQQAVERGFRFLKDKQFRVSKVYLKKEERIEALAMIMVLTLLIYSYAEWILRKRLKETGLSIPDQKGKPTQRPSLKRVFLLFYGITEVTIDSGGETHREITNLKGNYSA